MTASNHRGAALKRPAVFAIACSILSLASGPAWAVISSNAEGVEWTHEVTGSWSASSQVNAEGISANLLGVFSALVETTNGEGILGVIGADDIPPFDGNRSSAKSDDWRLSSVESTVRTQVSAAGSDPTQSGALVVSSVSTSGSTDDPNTVTASNQMSALNLGGPGSPTLGEVAVAGGVLTLNWTHGFQTPARFIGLAWDIYQEDWVGGGMEGSIYFPYSAASSSGQIPLILSGGYHAWIAAQYLDGNLHVSSDAWSGIAYDGAAHAPAELDVQARGADGRGARLSWKPETLGTWLYQIVAFEVSSVDPLAGAFVMSHGPHGLSEFHLVDFGEEIFAPGTASFSEGWADFTMLGDGDYVFFIRAAPWLSPYTPGAYGVSPVFSTGGP